MLSLVSQTGIGPPKYGNRAGRSHSLATVVVEVLGLDQELAGSPYRRAHCKGRAVGLCQGR